MPKEEKVFTARIASCLQVRYLAIVITNSSSTAKQGNVVISDGRTSIKVLAKIV